MELIQISESKLKIMLSEGDMAKYSLDALDDDRPREDTRRALRLMLSDLREMSGFDTSGERIFVQMYPSRDGGCEVFVTKLGAEKGDLTTVGSPAGTDVKKALSPCAYSFGSFDGMLAVCRYLYNCRADCRGDGVAYRDEGGNYYLSLPSRCEFAHSEEFSKRITPSQLDAYIAEHGRCLIESGAVEILGKL